MKESQANVFREPQNFQAVWDEAKQQKNLYEQVAIVARGILFLKGKRSAETTMSGREIFECFQTEMQKIGQEAEDFQKQTFLQYLSYATNNQGNGIFCEGRRKGYYVQDETKEEEEDTSEEEESEACEADMYPPIENWLFGKGYRAKIVAENRKNGTWGNPDVVGFKIQDFMGRMEVELVSIECKKTWDSWRHWFFEAVAHTRFVDRSYFAFVNRFDETSKQSEELFEYAEYFGIGILVLEVSSEDYEKFRNGEPVDLDNAPVREIYVAPPHKPQMKAKCTFLGNLGIRTTTDLMDYCDKISLRTDP